MYTYRVIEKLLSYYEMNRCSWLALNILENSIKNRLKNLRWEWGCSNLALYLSSFAVMMKNGIFPEIRMEKAIIYKLKISNVYVKIPKLKFSNANLHFICHWKFMYIWLSQYSPYWIISLGKWSVALFKHIM